MVARLEKKKLISRRVSPEDRRVVTLSPTEEGRALAEQLRTRLINDDRRALAMLNDAEREQLVSLLRKVIGWGGNGA
jgi:DNA-binding MarR family transcriptional regulator